MRFLALLSFFGCVVTGCTGAESTSASRLSEDGPETAQEAEGETDIELFYYDQPAPPQEGQFAALPKQMRLTGNLVVENGCLLLDSPERKRALVFERSSVTYDAVADAVVQNGRIIPVGSRVALGGPSVGENWDNEAIMQRCDVDDVWAVNVDSLELISG